MIKTLTEEDRISLHVAMEFGFKQAERGNNLDMARFNLDRTLNGGQKPVPLEKPTADFKMTLQERRETVWEGRTKTKGGIPQVKLLFAASTVNQLRLYLAPEVAERIFGDITVGGKVWVTVERAE